MATQDAGRAKRDAELALTAATAAASSALQAGARAPLFALPDAAGRKVELESLLRRGPAVLHFYRGSWCSYGGQSQAAFCATYAQVAALGAQALAISPCRGDGQPCADAVPDLHDQDLRVARSYGLAFELPPSLRTHYRQLGYAPGEGSQWLAPIPALYLVDRDGVIVLAALELDYRKRCDPAPLLQALRAIQPRRGHKTYFIGESK